MFNIEPLSGTGHLILSGAYPLARTVRRPGTAVQFGSSALKILDPEFARRIARGAGLRNRLVHEYNEIDPRKVFESLEAALADIPV